MTEETHDAPGASAHQDGREARESTPRSPMIFVTDAVAESSRVAETLRTAGYHVVDVPLGLLVSRAQTQRPNVVLLDVDATSAIDEIGRLRKMPGTGAIDLVYFGSGDGPIKSTEDAIANEGSAYFVRPIDLSALLRRIEALTGGPIARPESRRSTPPPSRPHPSGSPRLSSIPPDRTSTPSLPAPGLRTPGPPLPMSVPSLADLVDPPRSLAAFGMVSNELQQLLAEAELRAEVMPHIDAPMPSPEEEIETVLPADVLASLDEPIEADEDEEPEPRVPTGAGHDREGTGSHGKPSTTSGGSKQTTASGRSSSSSTPYTLERVGSGSAFPRSASESPSRSSDPPPAFRSDPVSRPSRPPVADDWSPQPAVQVTTSRFEAARPLGAGFEPPRPEMIPRADFARDGVTIDVLPPSQLPARGPSEAPPAPSFGIVVLSAVDARRFLAEAIARRLSGAICFDHERVIRRLVLRDGDLVTAASGAEQESLVCFLGARGELPRDEVERLAGKIPPYGRHAGAALVAHGWLGQDQLWSILRAHAEWIATAVLRLSGGTVQLEAEPPGRLRSEPSVFAASTGAEIFVELVRRAVSPEEAIDALGGEASRIGDGAAQSLLAECALPPSEVELVSRSRGGTLGDLLARSADAEIAAVVHGLALLGVLDVLPAPERLRPAAPTGPSDIEAALLDDEAVRARVRARMELVDEGDYFSLLGVPRDATSYEVRRAFVELRRTFEPTRILSPRLLDLEADVRKIVVVLEEAYEILRDVTRRERYRRAIDARPA
jgi:hypothetical protein